MLQGGRYVVDLQQLQQAIVSSPNSKPRHSCRTECLCFCAIAAPSCMCALRPLFSPRCNPQSCISRGGIVTMLSLMHVACSLILARFELCLICGRRRKTVLFDFVSLLCCHVCVGGTLVELVTLRFRRVGFTQGSKL